MFKSVAKRFLKGFIAGGLASTAAFLSAGITIHSLEDLRNLAIPLVIAFVTGGLLAVEKLLSWKDEAPAA